jgi:hypothetical protein
VALFDEENSVVDWDRGAAESASTGRTAVNYEEARSNRQAVDSVMTGMVSLIAVKRKHQIADACIRKGLIAGMVPVRPTGD